jgi:Kef-type K+ transport system membrane component KefB
MVALVVPIATGAGELTMAGLVLMAGKAVAFFLIVTFIGFWIFPKGPLEWLQKLPVFRALSMQSYLTFDSGKYATLAILLVALVVGLLAHLFGFHEAVGAYMAGLIVREEHFQLSRKDGDSKGLLAPENVFNETKRIVDNASSGMNKAESIMIGLGMLGRAELAFVVMDIAYVQHLIMPVEAFFTLMITAFCLNVLVPVTISWWRPYYLKATTDPSG